jgi:hypothetical protein
MVTPTCTCVVQASSSFPWATFVPASIGILIAFLVFIVALRQSLTAKEKLRLDLYNRRFDVYLKAFNYAAELERWDGSKQQRELAMEFVKAQRESSFLFKQDSGITPLLKEIHDRAIYITHRQEMNASMKEMTPDERKNMQQHYFDSLKLIGTMPERLTNIMMPYLYFDNIR